MRYSKLFGKTLRRAPKGAEAISHRLLVRGGFIDQLAAGIFSFLPLGWRVHRKIEKIIRQQMNAIGGQEVFLPTLQPKSLWDETERWDEMEPPLFKLKDRHEKELALGPTHEEVMTDLARRFIKSYKDLPLYLFQIQNKFRNEMRSTGGLLRVREFVMMDLYSFHTDEKDLDDYYQKVIEAYKRIFTRCGLVAKMVKAASGTIGGEISHEFQVKASQQIIEAGHVFKLGTQYSEKMGANFVDQKGKKKPIWMGCYGIGLGRLMAAIVEVHHDEQGIIWPESVAPFQAHLIAIPNGKQGNTEALKVYETLKKNGIEVLWDDRGDVSAGVKFTDADLIGISVRLVISEKLAKMGKIEYKKRDKKKVKNLRMGQVVKRLTHG